MQMASKKPSLFDRSEEIPSKKRKQSTEITEEKSVAKKQRKRSKSDSQLELEEEKPKAIKKSRGRPRKYQKKAEDVEAGNIIYFLIHSYYLAPEKEPKLTLYNKAINELAPYIWDMGRSQISLPTKYLFEPDPSWGARKKDENFVKVIKKLFLFFENFQNF